MADDARCDRSRSGGRRRSDDPRASARPRRLGIVCDSDKALNDRALRNASRLFSAYLLKDGTKVWIITESDRAAATVLLPKEY